MTNGMPWLKWYTETLDDPKLGRLSDENKWRFVEACTIAAECDASGALVMGDKPMSLDDIAWRTRSTTEHIRSGYDALIDAGMIELVDGVYRVKNFGKRQGRPWTERREGWRENKRSQREEVSSRTPQGHAESPLPRGRGEEEGEKEEEGEGECPPPATAFSFSEKWATVVSLMREAYKRAPDTFENKMQEAAYSVVLEQLNGELEAVVKKGLEKGIRTRGDMLTWLQGCAKRTGQRKTATEKRDKPGRLYQ